MNPRDLPMDAQAAVQVRPYRDGDRAAWAAFADACPKATFFHRIEWRDLMEGVFRHRTHYLVAERGGQIAGVLPMARVKSWLFERGRQKRSMAEMHAVAVAITSYGTDYSHIPLLADVNADQLAPYLEPTYIKILSAYDGWRRLLRYSSDGVEYTLICLGADGILDSTHLLGPTTSFNTDIIINDGEFAQWPEGMQTR